MARLVGETNVPPRMQYLALFTTKADLVELAYDLAELVTGQSSDIDKNVDRLMELLNARRKARGLKPRFLAYTRRK